MPALPPVPGVLRVAYEGTVSGRNWANVLHYGYTGAMPSELVLDVFNADLGTSWAAQMSPLQHPDVSLTNIKTTDLSAGGAQASGNLEGPIVGTRTGNPLPAQCAALVTYTTVQRWRGGHPRSYLLIGVDTDLDDANAWTSTFVTAASAAWEVQWVAPTGLTIPGLAVTDSGMVSYRLDKAPRTTPLYYETLSVSNVQGELATIRRRVRRAGHRR